MDITALRDALLTFRDERDWKQFHNPKDLAAAIAIEAGELQEKFLWISQQDSYTLAKQDPEVADEMADIFNNILLFADACGIDVIRVAQAKLAKNERKYPVEKSKGKCVKYDKL